MSKIISIANFFIEQSLKEQIPIDFLKIQKLVYFAFGFYGQKYDKYLFENPIHAWTYGPVVPELYNLLKQESIKQKGDFFIKKTLKNSPEPLKKEEEDTLKKVWERYRHVKSWNMVGETHQKGSPWEKTPPGAVMDKNQIIQYFKVAIPIMGYKSLFLKLSRE